MKEHQIDGALGYKQQRCNFDQAKQSRKDFPNDKSRWVDVLVIDFMKSFDCPNLVVKEVRFKHQLTVKSQVIMLLLL